MFDGAAGSAFFAVLLCVLFLASCLRGLVGVSHLFLWQSHLRMLNLLQVLTVYYMMFSTKNLGHPHNRYGRYVHGTFIF